MAQSYSLNNQVADFMDRMVKYDFLRKMEF